MKPIFQAVIFGLFLTNSFQAQTITDVDRRAFENLDKIEIDLISKFINQSGFCCMLTKTDLKS